MANESLGMTRKTPVASWGVCLAQRGSLAFVAAALLACSGDAARSAQPPQPLRDWSDGLGRSGSVVPSARDGLVVLETPGPNRIGLPGGTFGMGSTQADVTTALALCNREVLRDLCGGSGRTTDFMLLLYLETDQHPVTLSPFSIDRTEVSVAAYGRCVAAGSCAAPGFDATDRRFSRPDFPVTEVRWQDATAFCAWSGGRLPTEAEWEYAARGLKGRTFPWGNEWASRRANHGAYAPESTDASDGYVGLAPVESFADGATPEGILNLAGNVAEWVSDLVDVQGRVGPRTEVGLGLGYDKLAVRNPRGADSGEHVIRGGSYRAGAPFLRGAMRGILHAASQSDHVGFRCVYE